MTQAHIRLPERLRPGPFSIQEKVAVLGCSGYFRYPDGTSCFNYFPLHFPVRRGAWNQGHQHLSTGSCVKSSSISINEFCTLCQVYPSCSRAHFNHPWGNSCQCLIQWARSTSPQEWAELWWLLFFVFRTQSCCLTFSPFKLLSCSMQHAAHDLIGCMIASGDLEQRLSLHLALQHHRPE